MFDQKLKSCTFQIKDLDQKQGIVQFYGSAFGSSGADKDSDNDVILKGAFKKTISDNAGRIKHCLNHSRWDVPGVFKELKEDSTGLLCTSQLAKGSSGEFSTLAKDTLINYEAGVITEHSIGYRAIKEAYDEVEQANFISEIKLWEVSSLTAWGANQNTPFVGMKSIGDLMDQLKAIDKALHSSTISDEGAKKLLKYSEQINITLKSLSADKITEEPINAKKSAIDYTFLKNNY